MQPIARPHRADKPLTYSAACSSPVAAQKAVFGRVVNIVRFKARCFVWCLTEQGLVQLIAPAERCGGIAPGHLIQAFGDWQAYSGTRPGFADQELLVDRVETLAQPPAAEATAWRHPSGAARQFAKRRLRTWRARMLSAALNALHTRGFRPVLSPPIVGEEARHGPTAMFDISHADQLGSLSVNALWAHLEHHARGIEKAYQLSTLYWAQDYGNRFSQNEISLLEISASDAGPSDLIALVETLICTVLTQLRRLPDGRAAPDLRAPSDFADLPRVSFFQAVDWAQQDGLLPKDVGHVLPASVNTLLCKRVGRPGCWIVGAPPEASPFYSRTVPGADGTPQADSFELRIANVPNVASGSAWRIHTDGSAARVPPAYAGLLGPRLPRGAAVSVGIDRLAMALLGAGHIRDVATEQRNRMSFAAAPVSEPAVAKRLTLGTRAAVGEDSVFVEQATALAGLEARLRDAGFAPVTSGLLEDPRNTEEPSPRIDYFGREVALRRDWDAAFARLFADSLSRCYRLGPGEADPGDWWRLYPVLDLAFLGTNDGLRNSWARWVERQARALSGVTGSAPRGGAGAPLPRACVTTRSGVQRDTETPGFTVVRLHLARLPGFVWGRDGRESR